MRALVIAVLLLGCRRGGESTPAQTKHEDGTERGNCYGNSTCNDGLACMSNLCVRLPGADCGAIVEHLAGLLLDNYTPRDERERWTTQTKAECDQAGLSKADGACLLDAKFRNALAKCPKRVGTGDCPVIVAFVRRLPGNDPDLKTDADRIADRCKNEVPSKTFETCALSARAVADLARCTW